MLAESTKDKLADHCRKVVIKGPDAEIPFAASVLVSTAVGWDELSDPERKKLFLSANPSAWRWAALALAKNGRRKELMEWASERPAEDHLDVVWVLKHDLPKEWSDAELAFWLKCAGHYPRDMAYVLRACHRPIPTVFREPIRADLLRELAKPTVKRGGTQPAYSLVAAVEVLDAWNNPEDTPLLMDCLKHPVHSIGTRSDGVQSTQIRTYELRTRVRPILERRGVELPAGVVYREEIKPGTE